MISFGSGVGYVAAPQRKTVSRMFLVLVIPTALKGRISLISKGHLRLISSVSSLCDLDNKQQLFDEKFCCLVNHRQTYQIQNHFGRALLWFSSCLIGLSQISKRKTMDLFKISFFNQLCHHRILLQDFLGRASQLCAHLRLSV